MLNEEDLFPSPCGVVVMNLVHVPGWRMATQRDRVFPSPCGVVVMNLVSASPLDGLTLSGFRPLAG